MHKASECTLYSGGHVGAETFFGECAERHGVAEVTFSFEGHHIKRDKGLVMLSDADLKRGDVSMEIISIHMHRQYAQSEKTRRIFQSIFHMVNKGLQVFAVGVIQDDNTVKGGTGWSVELGKFFNRKVHVFDQVKNVWFTWRHDEWVVDMPVISETTFCGSGTRDITDESRKAVEALFTQSLGAGK